MLANLDNLKQYGYRAVALLQNKAYIFRDGDDAMVVIPLDELQWGNASLEEMKAIIERYFDALAAGESDGEGRIGGRYDDRRPNTCRLSRNDQSFA